MATTSTVPSSSVTSFLSLHALHPEQLAQLLVQSIVHHQEEDDEDDKYVESVTEAIGICEQSLKILYSLKKNKNKKRYHIKHIEERLTTNRHNVTSLSPDILLIICEYLDPSNKTRLRFTSMSMHIDMMGCPLDLGEIRNTELSRSDTELSLLVESYAPMKVFKRFTLSSCGCNASQQLQLIDLGTPVNQTLCSHLTDSQLLQLGIGRSWSITGMDIDECDTSYTFERVCTALEMHNASRSIKRFEYQRSVDNQSIMYLLPTCHMAASVEVLVIDGSERILNNEEEIMSLDTLLPPFKTLRCLHLKHVPLEGTLHDIVQYSPQIEKLKFTGTNLTGSVSCLAPLKNLTALRLLSLYAGSFFGDIASLSSLTKLKELTLQSSGFIGNLSSLTTLTGLRSLILSDTKIEGKIESLLKHLSQLIVLSLCGNENVTGNLVFPESIHLFNVAKSDIYLDLSSLVSLKKLSCAYLIEMPNVRGDISILSTLTTLTVLQLSTCFQVTGHVNSLATLPLLNDIHLSRLPNVTGDEESFMEVYRSQQGYAGIDLKIAISC